MSAPGWLRPEVFEAEPRLQRPTPAGSGPGEATQGKALAPPILASSFCRQEAQHSLLRWVSLDLAGDDGRRI